MPPKPEVPESLKGLTMLELDELCCNLTAQIDEKWKVENEARNMIHQLTKQRNAAWQEALRPWVGKTFKRGNYYAILSDVPQEQEMKTGTSFNVQQLPAMIFVYNEQKNIDVRRHPEEMGLMWPDTLFRGEMPDEYNTQGAHNLLDREKWVEIPTTEWIDAYQARCLQVQRDLLAPITPAL